jgi:predicted PurR-regulated permease PerM
VGSWSVYIPTGVYLLVFQDAPWEAVGMIAGGFLLNTVLFSLVIRPKLAATQSGVLNFYWMFLALVAGVYAFGVPGIVLGPILVGLLKAVFDTITADVSWAEANGGSEAEMLAEEELASPSDPEKDGRSAEKADTEPSRDAG